MDEEDEEEDVWWKVNLIRRVRTYNILFSAVLLFLAVIRFLGNFNKEYVLIIYIFFSVLPKCALTQLALLFLVVIGFHGMLGQSLGLILCVCAYVMVQLCHYFRWYVMIAFLVHVDRFRLLSSIFFCSPE